ncbi:MAG: hypothetical protein IJ106_11040 [Parasporobacterium sp.]|nr:hypothetical protein [Parasporobacterium sp.]
MAEYDYGRFMEQAQKDYERRNTPGKGTRTEKKEIPGPELITGSGETVTEKETAGKRPSVARTAAKSRKQKEALAEGKKSLTILLPPDVYIGLKMMAIRRMTKVSSLICDLYRDEEEREKRRTRQ